MKYAPALELVAIHFTIDRFVCAGLRISAKRDTSRKMRENHDADKRRYCPTPIKPMLLSPLAELKYMSRGRSLIVMGLEKNEKLQAFVVSDQTKLIVSGVARGREKDLALADAKLWHYAGHRARMGRVLPDKLKPTALKLMPKPAELPS